MSDLDERDGNLAFKCTYHDGGPAGFVGYAGTCSDANIIRNVRLKKATWCSQDHNPCKQFLDNECGGRRPKDPCYESRLLLDWKFGAGFYHRGDKEGTPIPMHRARPGKVVLLTTRVPDEAGRDEEANRIVFAVAKVRRVAESDELGTHVIAVPQWSLRVPEDVARRLPYWRFKEGDQKWHTGLFRYLEDNEVAAYLRSLFVHLQSPHERTVVAHLLDCVGSLPPSVDETFLTAELEQVPTTLKYGPGGEGERHLRLKNFVASNPHVLGLGAARRVFIEHSFITGDRVDVAVELMNGEFVVVEIEVDGATQTMIGAHQALKYRALMLAQRDASKLPHSVLVAYDVPTSTRAFCERHQVRALALTPE